MTAVVQELVVEAGADWDLTFTYCHTLEDEVTADPAHPFDITGYSAILEVRLNNQTTDDAPLFVCSTQPQPGISPELSVPVGTDGQIVLHVPAVRTISLPQATWTAAFGSGTPNTHYTLRLIGPLNQQRFVTTGDLLIKPA